MGQKLNWMAEEVDSLQIDLSTDSGQLEAQRSRDRGLLKISRIDTFVREAIQNSKDQALDRSQPIEVRIRFRQLDAAAQRRFLESANLADPIAHYEACAEFAARRQSERLMHEFVRRDQSAVSELLYIEDFRTRGLTGPISLTLDSVVPPGSANFAMLLLSKGATELGIESRGGSWGYGKSVYWAASALKCCLFYSQFKDEQSGKMVQRIAGRSHLVVHPREGRKYSGVVVAGASGGPGNPYRPIEGSDLGVLAAELGFTPRDSTKASDCGTSICVIDPRFRSETAEGEFVKPTAEQVSESVARYYWPSIEPCGGLDPALEVLVASHGTTSRRICVSDFPYLKPFVEAAQLPKDEGVWRVADERRFQVRRRKAGELELMGGRIFLAARECDEDLGPLVSGRVALIRGARMVVGYYDVPVHREQPIAAVVLAGNAIRESDDPIAQARLEDWLKRSESAAHDCWSAESENLPDIRGAKAQILAVEDFWRGCLKEFTQGVGVLAGTGSPILSSLLRLPGAGKGRSRATNRRKVRRALSIEYTESESGWRKDGSHRTRVRVSWNELPAAGECPDVNLKFAGVLVDDHDSTTAIGGAKIAGITMISRSGSAISVPKIDYRGNAECQFALQADGVALIDVDLVDVAGFRDLAVQLEVETFAEVAE
jgi:hypothetical protein